MHKKLKNRQTACKSSKGKSKVFYMQSVYFLVFYIYIYIYIIFYKNTYNYHLLF